MTAAESKNSLARHAAPFGAIVEEDTGLRGMRVFQVVAPYGTVWSDGVKNIRCDVDSSREKQSQTYNRREVAYARSRIERGVQPMTAQERFEFDEEGTT